MKRFLADKRGLANKRDFADKTDLADKRDLTTNFFLIDKNNMTDWNDSNFQSTYCITEMTY